MGAEEVVTDSVADALKQGMNQRNFGSPVFKTGAFNRSATLPVWGAL